MANSKYHPIKNWKNLWYPASKQLQIWLATLAFSTAIVGYSWWFTVGVFKMWGINVPMDTPFTPTFIQWFFGIVGAFFALVIIVSVISIFVLFIRACVGVKERKTEKQEIIEEIHKIETFKDKLEQNNNVRNSTILLAGLVITIILIKKYLKKL